jgi:hypothetical protein
MLTREQVKDIFKQVQSEHNLEEQDFVRRYRIGYLCAGNSIYDLVTMLFDSNGLALETLDDLVNEYDTDSDLDRTAQEAYDEINYYLKCHDEVKQSQMTLIAG